MYAGSQPLPAGAVGYDALPLGPAQLGRLEPPFMKHPQSESPYTDSAKHGPLSRFRSSRYFANLDNYIGGEI